MNRNTFIFSMIMEGFFSLVSMGLLFSDVGAVIYIIALAVLAAVLAPFYIRLRKESDEEKKRKIRKNMALVLLIPIVIGVVAVALVVIGLPILYA